ncbi:transmembrane protein 198-B-like [Varroa jacobsoni]|uniref:Transmembrane protein 198 n=1 Tax=Varroa destructor TaxID=109461 RepID=A0A7M7M601_VARDE|nr:transmembrane protein 198-B-like [Varroa destructor]XP_022651957.1 transmembrane protein 198-B-like [Varroa destructor]XP_022651958.1 transmembrane protein 198-B-like [Varroa destructor]XP_022651959.1 transmembrane protein 198-B-like [Varroa destructor]XP_022701539.1 transmembrane protein 198-B-like [Varroa jacobsoni]XP_022701540.1 transmembrane protein 198-B-like [Varroa jacobsoni]XP_022701541.1 transmembrane protein 198-B-like [Varroa jacobsoni]XP_022701542.1 transmembrane protein 198-B
MATAVSTEQWPRHTDHFLDEARDYNVSSGALPDCESIPLDYDPYPASVFSCLALFGLVFVLYGYRAFKLTMFLTGFMFATLIVYKICTVEDLLPMSGNVGVSVGAGVLFGLITTLVQHAGLFVLGFHSGLFGGISGIVISRLLGSTPVTMWICVGIFMVSGIIGSMANLYFQKGLTVIGSSVYGGALLSLSADYFMSRAKMGHWVLSMISLKTPQPVCWFSWATLALWPGLILLGLVTQFCVTGRGLHHERMTPARQSRNFNLQRVRQEETRAQQQQRKYRYLYQIRTSHGDVISQNYLQSLQSKKVPPASLNGDDSVSMLHGSDQLTHLTVLNNAPESAHTTLSHVP